MKNSRSNVVFGVLLAAIAIAAVLFFLNGRPVKEPPSASGYYTGAFRNKKNPSIYGDENGKQVPAPPGDAPYNPTPGRSPGAATDAK